jgi:hypothetical protein
MYFVRAPTVSVPAESSKLSSAVHRDGVDGMWVVRYEVARGCARPSSRGGHASALQGAAAVPATGAEDKRLTRSCSCSLARAAAMSFLDDLMADILGEAPQPPPAAVVAAAAPQPLVIDWRILCDADLRIRARQKLYA